MEHFALCAHLRSIQSTTRRPHSQRPTESGCITVSIRNADNSVCIIDQSKDACIAVTSLKDLFPTPSNIQWNNSARMNTSISGLKPAEEALTMLAIRVGILFSNRPRPESLGPRHVLVAHSGSSTKRLPRPKTTNTGLICPSHLRIPVIAIPMHAGYWLGVTVDSMLTCASMGYRNQDRHTVGPRQYQCGRHSAWGSLVLVLLTVVVSRLRSYGLDAPLQGQIDRL
jgi:hypothetical protein